MILTENQRNALLSSQYNASDYHWPNKTIPVEINQSHTSDQIEYIADALTQLESVSCLQFVERTNETDYVRITVSRCKHFSVIFFL